MLANNWWFIGLRGALGVIIGMLALTTPGETKSVLIVCYATYMFLDGILAIEAALAISPHHTDWVELILEGVVNLFAGAVALLLPIETLFATAWIIGGCALVSGALLLIAALRLHGTYGRDFFILCGIASTAWGIALMIAPTANAAAMARLFGAYTLVFGSALFGLAFRLRERHQHQAS